MPWERISHRLNPLHLVFRLFCIDPCSKLSCEIEINIGGLGFGITPNNIGHLHVNMKRQGAQNQLQSTRMLSECNLYNDPIVRKKNLAQHVERSANSSDTCVPDLATETFFSLHLGPRLFLLGTCVPWHCRKFTRDVLINNLEWYETERVGRVKVSVMFLQMQQ